MRQEGAAGPAATATSGMSDLLRRIHDRMGNVSEGEALMALGVIHSTSYTATSGTGYVFPEPTSWSGTTATPVMEALMGKKKKRSKAQGKAAAKAKAEKKQPKMKGRK